MNEDNKRPVRRAPAKTPAKTPVKTPAKAVYVKEAPKQESALRTKFRAFNFKLRKQRIKYGTIATVLTIVVVTAVILLNVFTGVLTEKLGLTFDMTSDERFTITDETKDILKNLAADEKINAYMFMTETDFRSLTYGNEMAEILQRFVVEGDGKFNLEYVDPLRNPSLVSKYSSEVSIASGTLVVEKNGNYRALPLKDLYYWYDSTQEQAVGVSIERKLATTILYITAEDQPTAALLWGHGETQLTQLNALLQEANYKVILVNLQTDEIPAETSLLIMCAPNTDYTESEISKLETYLTGYNNFVYAASAECPELPDLELFFREWGVTYDNSLICDSKYRISSDYTAIVTVPASGVTNTMAEGISISNFVVMPYSKPINMLWAESGLVTATELLQSSTSSYAKALSESTTMTSYEKEDGDISGTFSSAVLVSKSQIVDNVTKYTKLLFLSSPYVFSADIMNTESYGNTRFVTNVLSDFNPESAAVEMRSKRYTDPELEVIGNTRTVIFVLLCAIPAATLLMGIVVWYRRKNR